MTLDGRFLFAPESRGGKVHVIDVQSRAVAQVIPMVDEAGSVMDGLHNTYASHDGRYMYVTAIFSRKIAQIDLKRRAITRIYPLSGQPRPAGLTKDDARMYLQLSELHGFIELDLATGVETKRIEWPEPAEQPPGMSLLSIPTKCHGLGITLDETEVWAATNLESAVYVYSLPDLQKKTKISVGKYPNWVAFSSDGKTGYVTNTDVLAEHGTVSVIDVATHEVTSTVDVGPAPKRIHLLEMPAP